MTGQQISTFKIKSYWLIVGVAVLIGILLHLAKNKFPFLDEKYFQLIVAFPVLLACFFVYETKLSRMAGVTHGFFTASSRVISVVLLKILVIFLLGFVILIRIDTEHIFGLVALSVLTAIFIGAIFDCIRTSRRFK